MALRPTLYYTLFSPPSRAALLTSKLINLNLDLKPLDFNKKENHSEWFLKLNPRHTVPVLVDEGTPLVDSHAIVSYMVSKYGRREHDHLYPKDLMKRAVVNERLFYDNGVLFQVIRDFVAKIFYGDAIVYDRQSVALAHLAYGHLEQFLTRNTYVAGNELSVADISINATLLSLHKLVAVEEQRYPKIFAWMHRMRRELPDYEEINEKGAQLLYQRFQSGLEENMTKNT